VAAPESQFYAHPLTDERGPKGYWGLCCQVPFEHEKRQATHKGLVVLSGPMRTAVRQGRAAQFREVHQVLQQLQSQIGQPRLRTVKAVQYRARTTLKSSPVGKLMHAEAYTDEQDQLRLRWWVDRDALRQVMEKDGRYLLVTNNEALSPQHILALYHQKDGVEKRICVSKNQLKVSPIYLHKDERIEAMLLINMLALLAYSLLERQARQGGLQMTTRRIIEKLQSLDVVETRCWDGSYLLRLVPVDDEQIVLLQVLAQVLADLRLPHWPRSPLPAGNGQLWSLPPPRDWQSVP
jgi:transposase